ncbi:MAG: hypothetical protein PHY64_01800, partial [Eubacteriales bacterium]|nr:hypothetical protein [Eubacteriales bacterium]
RPLHVRQALDVVDPALRGLRTRLPETEKAGEHVVLSVPAFTLGCLCVTDSRALAACETSFRMVTALDALTLTWQGGKLSLAAGESGLIPARSPMITVTGCGRALIASAGC